MAERTPEQIKADDELTAAIEASMRAYGWEDGSLLTDWIVLTVQQSFDGEGRDTTGYGSLYRDNNVPTYRILGLLRAATLMAERQFEGEPS